MPRTYLDWDRIKTVLLDMDGTLLDLHFDNHFWLEYVPKCYAEKHNISLEESNDRLMQRYIKVKGSLDWYCVDYWTDELGMDIAQLKSEVAHKISIHPQVEDFLHALQKSNKRSVLVTNAHQASLSLKMETTGLKKYFDNIVISHDLGLAKEHEGFWERLKQKESYDVETTLLIDDNIEVLDCASEYGIAYLLAIHQPDSQKEVIESKKYLSVKNFKDIIPT